MAEPIRIPEPFASRPFTPPPKYPLPVTSVAILCAASKRDFISDGLDTAGTDVMGLLTHYNSRR